MEKIIALIALCVSVVALSQTISQNTESFVTYRLSLDEKTMDCECVNATCRAYFCKPSVRGEETPASVGFLPFKSEEEIKVSPDFCDSYWYNPETKDWVQKLQENFK